MMNTPQSTGRNRGQSVNRTRNPQLESNISEVRHTFKQMGVDLPNSLFEEPSRHDAVWLFELLICHVFSIELTNQIPNIEKLPDEGKIHQKALFLMRLLRYVQRLGYFLGIDNVNLSDIVKPTVTRLLDFMLAFGNFMKHKETCLQENADLWQHTEQLNEDAYSMEEDNVKLTQKLNALKTKLQKKQKEVAEGRALKEQLTTSLKLHNAQYEEEKQRSVKLTTKKKELEKRMREFEFQITEAKQRQKDLNDKVVDSPQQLLKALSDVEAQIAREENLLREEDRRCVQYEIRALHLERAKKRLQKATTMLQGLRRLQEETEKLRVRMRDAIRTAKNRESEVAEQTKKAATMRAELDEMRTRWSAEEARLKAEYKATEAEYEEAMQKQKAKSDKQTHDIEVARNCEMNFKALEKELADEAAAHQDELRVIQDLLRDLDCAVNAFLSSDCEGSIHRRLKTQEDLLGQIHRVVVNGKVDNFVHAMLAVSK